MKYLNLTEGFVPYSCPQEDVIKYETFTFSGGEPHIKILDDYSNEMHEVTVSIRINSFNDMGLLMIAMEALKQTGWVKDQFLLLPYFPGARQDRRMVPGEPLTVKVYADVINEMDFGEVIILDPHSDVTPAVVDKVSVVNNHELVHECLKVIHTSPSKSAPYLISPDAGSNKKVKDLAMYLNKHSRIEVVKCDKTRDVTTGKISGFEVYADDLKGRDCIIVDDICDAGGTFLGLASELKAKGAGDLYLVVTHGIFSKGFDKLTKYFKEIYCTDSFKSLEDDTYNGFPTWGKLGVFQIKQ